MSKKKIRKRSVKVKTDRKTIKEAETGKGFWENLSTFERLGVFGIGLLVFIGLLGGTGFGESVVKTFSGDSQSSNDNETSFFSKLNPFAAAPSPTPIPELSKEYIYAGSRLLAVEDADATAVPPIDLAIWRPSTGVWYVLGSSGTQTIEGWGMNGDKPAPGDYDGDGKTDFCVFRASNSTWYVMRTSDSSWETYSFGLGTDELASADYDGDGKTDAAVWRPSNGTWYIRESSTQALIYPPFGLSGDIPVPADYDGDGKADLGVWRENDPLGPTFYVQRSSDGLLQFQAYGIAGDVPAVADYDGDGKADYSVRRGATWYVMKSSDGGTLVYNWGVATDKEVPNDYDGDGKADIGVWRESNGTWYILNSSGNPASRIVQWGAAGDIPVPAYYRR